MGGNGTNEGERYAVVTGANKGIGLEIVRQLASVGNIVVVLTARDETKGREATSKLNQMGLSNVIFHQLDVLDPVSIQSLAIFIREKFARLDILINNAGATSVVVDEEALKALNIDLESWHSGKATTPFQEVTKQTYEQAEECINTNYYGVKRVTEALLPLLQLSQAKARIVNVSSRRGVLKNIPNEHIRNELGGVETLSEEKIDTLLTQVLHNLKENSDIQLLPAYPISKACLNAYTRILAKKYPNMLINCVHPGYVNTDLTWHRGTLTAEEGARSPVMLALLPEEGPTGCYFHLTDEAEF